MGLEPNDVGYSIGLTVAAGLATTIGATFAFCIPPDDNRIFSISLALAAGVMAYVSYIEIFYKSADSYEKYGYSPEHAFCLATATFFGGMLFSIGMELISNFCIRKWNIKQEAKIVTAYDYDIDERMPQKDASIPLGEVKVSHERTDETVPSEAVEQPKKDEAVSLNDIEPDMEAEGMQKCSSLDTVTLDTEPQESNRGPPLTKKEKASLLSTGIFSGVAIAVHNFPEGLATFVAAMEDPHFGVGMAVAIAIHNIPEGLCVAVPILKATGNKWKAFFWAFLSGISEPIGALLGWAVLKDALGPLTYAILFGLIGGVMVHIAIRKLYPTALKYDPDDRYASYSFFIGNAIMALSLVAFQL